MIVLVLPCEWWWQNVLSGVRKKCEVTHETMMALESMRFSERCVCRVVVEKAMMGWWPSVCCMVVSC